MPRVGPGAAEVAPVPGRAYVMRGWNPGEPTFTRSWGAVLGGYASGPVGYGAVEERTLVGVHPEVRPLLGQSVQRARLLDAIVDVVAAKGYDAATVADIVKVARVSRGTFYELFDSKRACFAAAYVLGSEVLEQRVDEAVHDAADWREELRLGIRAYLTAFVEEPRFALVFLTETRAIAQERDEVIRRFATRYGLSLKKSGRPKPPDDALFVLAAGVDELAHAAIRAGRDVTDLEETLVGCAVRFAAEEEPWT